MVDILNVIDLCVDHVNVGNMTCRLQPLCSSRDGRWILPNCTKGD